VGNLKKKEYSVPERCQPPQLDGDDQRKDGVVMSSTSSRSRKRLNLAPLVLLGFCLGFWAMVAYLLSLLSP
jgi:hypothetical protein